MAAFTTIAALGMSAAGSAFSFIQAGKQAQADTKFARSTKSPCSFKNKL